MTQTSNDITSLVEVVNQLLLDGEPDNISADTHSAFGGIGYKPQSIVDALNTGLGYGVWGFKEVSSEIISDEKTTMAVSQVEVWLSGIDFKPTGWGQMRVVKGDIGDARKGAASDALKKALSYFSIGNRAYLGLLKEGNGHSNRPSSQPQPTVKNTLEGSPASEQQLREIARLANALDRKVARPATYKAANELLTQLSREYNAQAKSA